MGNVVSVDNGGLVDGGWGDDNNDDGDIVSVGQDDDQDVRHTESDISLRSPGNKNSSEEDNEQDDGDDSTTKSTTPIRNEPVTTPSSTEVSSAFPTGPSTASQEDDSTTKSTTPIRNEPVTTPSSTEVTSAFPTGPSTALQEYSTMEADSTTTPMSTSSTTVTTSPFMDANPTSPTGLSSVSHGMLATQTSSHSPIKRGNMRAVLVTTFPIVAVTFLLLLLVGFIFLRKKSLKGQRSKQDAVKSLIKESQLELGDMKHSSGDFGGAGENGKERKVAIENQNATGKLTCNEADENSPPTSEVNTTPTGIMVPPDNAKVCTQGSDGYEEAKVQGTQSNDGYKEVLDIDKNQGSEKVKGRREHADQGHEAVKLADQPSYHTLNPNAQDEASYTSAGGIKKDGDYDALDRQKIPVSKPDPNYDLTDRICKVDANIKSSYQIGSEYSATCSSSANTSAYDKLEHTTRKQKADNISPYEYNILQPEGKV